MRQPPPPANGPGPQPGRDGGLPGVPGTRGELRLGDFGKGAAGETCPPGPRLAAAVDRLSGPDRRCAQATDEELIGLLGRWAAVESWAAAGKLGVIAELTRRRAKPGHQNRAPVGLPDSWEEGLGHEVALALSVALPTADKLAGLAWTLQARLPDTGAKLADGTISQLKAQIIADELAVLNAEHATEAEALILDDLAGKTPGQIGKLAATAAVTVDPHGAQRRREQAERDDARVRFWRECTGTSALAAYGLPTDAALAANANIRRRAQEYKRAKLDGTMDQLRVLAFLDILNGITATARIAQARADTDAQAAAGQAQPAADPMPAGTAPTGTGATGDGPAGNGLAGNGPADDWDLDDGPVDDQSWDDGDLGADSTPDGESAGDGTEDRESGGDAPGDGGPRGGGPGGGPGAGPDPDAGDAGPALAASTNLTIPLATLLGLAGRPGQGHGLGPIDPGLARDLAAAAARSPHSTWCVTVTDQNGIAIGHGCATRARPESPPGSRDGPPAFTPRDDPGPPGGYGTWTLILPGGRRLAVKLAALPVDDCDHRYESRGYQPSDMLRHLVQIRDGECTFVCCSRHARESDFEHAVPYEKGGRTCLCNAGARSRRCHQVKQSRGWTVTQPRPGWHEWTTPSGRTYVQGPAKYPI